MRPPHKMKKRQSNRHEERKEMVRPTNLEGGKRNGKLSNKMSFGLLGSFD